jgi:hypothetical protein
MKQLTSDLLTPITANKEDLERKIQGAKNLHIKTVSVWGEYTSHFFKLFLEHQEKGYVPLPETATNSNSFIKINMTKPDSLLESEYEKITLKVTDEYESSIRHKEKERKQSLKREQDRIRAEMKAKEEEQALLNEIMNTKV